MKSRVAPRCIVCAQQGVVEHRLAMCQSCNEAYDRHNRRSATTLELIRWAAGRARRMLRKQEKSALVEAFDSASGYE